MSIDVEDFITKSAMLTFSPGETEKCEMFDIVNDEIREDMFEDFVIGINTISPDSVGVGENSTSMITIVDDDSK